MASLPTFVVTLVHEEFHLKLRSTCQACGASQVLSAADGSLQQWQEGHQCPGPEPKPVAPAERKVARAG